MVANAILFLYRDFENECNKAMRFLGLSRKKVWMPRFALSLEDSLLIYRIDCSFNFF